jgi:hypothetical protein
VEVALDSFERRLQPEAKNNETKSIMNTKTWCAACPPYAALTTIVSQTARELDEDRAKLTLPTLSAVRGETDYALRQLCAYFFTE